MTTFSTLCTAEMSKAEHDPNYVGGVCRINKNDTFLITFRNNGYDTPASTPMMGATPLQLDPAPRIPPVRSSVKREMEMIHQHPAEREYSYWNNLYLAASRDQMTCESDALAFQKRQGGTKDYESCLRIVKAEQLATIEKKRANAAIEMGRKYNGEIHASFISAKTQEEYVALQTRSLSYPAEYTTPQIPNTLGGHAEENFIRAWSALYAHIPEKITSVELFITRMPCPDASAGFWLGANLYKEGCMSKFAKLITTTDESINWEITYSQTLNGADQAFSQSLTRFFPTGRVNFSARGT
ncbi:hypothetical protein PMI21_02451 [Pseudomonas sp. GM18]|uniref:hypothetical protein n=1 Tax=Pseudomonas sp. GM18 TaxID=1144324 RepID=UPI0002722A60|nr:hypothetical protein [Pseudomonas sp. GM18]EJM17742.1 hypothetical protein PMI21_02451 [Pseudomonas sp. GM18]